MKRAHLNQAWTKRVNEHSRVTSAAASTEILVRLLPGDWSRAGTDHLIDLQTFANSLKPVYQLFTRTNGSFAAGKVTRRHEQAFGHSGLKTIFSDVQGKAPGCALTCSHTGTVEFTYPIELNRAQNAIEPGFWPAVVSPAITELAALLRAAAEVDAVICLAGLTGLTRLAINTKSGGANFVDENLTFPAIRLTDGKEGREQLKFLAQAIAHTFGLNPSNVIR